MKKTLLICSALALGSMGITTNASSITDTCITQAPPCYSIAKYQTCLLECQEEQSGCVADAEYAQVDQATKQVYIKNCGNTYTQCGSTCKSTWMYNPTN